MPFEDNAPAAPAAVPAPTQAADANQVTPTPPANGAEQPGAPAANEPPAGEAGKQGEPQEKQEGATEGEGEHTERDEQGRFKPKLQKRIDELTRARHQAERDRDYWRQQAEARQAPPAAPKPEDFASDDDYQQALLDHRIESGINRKLSTEAQQRADMADQQANEVRDQTYAERMRAATTRIPDFAEVVGKANIDVRQEVIDAIKDSEHGPDIAYHLAKNPDEARRLSQMDTRSLDRAIGRMEADFAAKGTTPAPAARTTNAPAPARTGAPAAAAPANNDPSKMSQAEFEVWMRANGSRIV
jgi:hypothetical protein